jgi:hypothetical protein
MKILKMKALLEGFDPQSTVNQSSVPPQEKVWSPEEKKAALEAIGSYNEFGNHLRREHNLMEIAHKLGKIAESAEQFTLAEVDDWFDKKTVSENMKQLRKVSEEFNKLAKEAHVVQQRMEALYEDGGHVLSRYFEIKNLDEGAIAISKLNKK